MRKKKALMKSFSAGCADADVTAYIAQSGITDATEISAVCQLVTDLKNYSLWSKFDIIYPFLGSSVSSGTVNLKNPALYQMTFNALATDSFSSMGWITAWGADTNLVSSSLTYGDTHLACYSRSDVNGAAYDFYVLGCLQYFSRLSNLMLCDMYNTSGGATTRITTTNTNSIGFNMVSRTLPDSFALYKNGTLLKSQTGLGGALNANNLLIGTQNDGALTPPTRNYAFMSVGLGMNATEASNFNTAVLDFCTTLGRNL